MKHDSGSALPTADGQVTRKLKTQERRTHGFKPVALARERSLRLLACTGKFCSSHWIFGRNRMLHKCANPNCTSPFHKLSQGKLFLVDMPLERSDERRTRWRVQSRSRIEYYWLCDQCAFALTLSYEKGRGVVAVPRPESAKKLPAAALQIVERPNSVSLRSERSA
jgi:hypothetical protein